MKDKFQSLVGMRGACGWLNDPLITHLSPTNHPLKHGVGKYIFSFLLVLAMSIGQMWAADPVENVGTYSTQVISADGTTSTWTFITPGSQVTIPTSPAETEDNDIIFHPGGGSKMKFSSSNGLSWSGNSDGYIYVPADAAGTISITLKSNSDSRYLQLYVNGSAAADTKRLWSKYAAEPTSDGKKGPQSFSFTSSDLTTKGEKTYLHFKDNNTEMKIATFTVTLTTGTYLTPSCSTEISTQPSGATIAVGDENPELSIVATNVASYAWKESSDGTSYDGASTLATTADYTPSVNDAVQTKYYYCEVTSSCDGAEVVKSDIVTVNVVGSITYYTVTLVPDGGTISDATGWTLNAGNYEKEVADGTVLTLPTFTKENRTFKTWRKAGPTDVASPITVTADVTLTAVWTATIENVLYSWEGAEGGATEVGGTVSGSAENLINQLSAGYYCLKIDGNNSYSGNLVTITLSGEEKVKTGDKIKYWGFYSKSSSANARPKMRDANGSNAQIFDDGTNLPNLYGGGEPAVRTFTVPADINTNAVQLTRSQTGSNTWIPKIQIIREVQVEEGDLLTVTFDTKGGSSISPVMVASGQTVAKPADPTKEHNRFNEWQLSGSAYNFSTPVTSSITLDATWTPLYTVTYAANGGSGTMTDANEYAAGDEVTLLENTFEAPDVTKIWDSWAVTDALDNPVSVSAGKFAMPSSNATVTAQWTTISDFDVKFFQGYGDPDVQIGETQSISTGNFAAAPAEDPERAGYRFLGWSYDATAEHIVNVSEYAITAATNFTAMWIQQFAVTFDGAGEVLVDNGATVASPNSPVTAGKVFQGWYNGESKYDFSAAVTGNLTLESKWADAVANHYTYAYNDDFHFDGVVYKTPEGKVDEGAGASNVAITTPYTLFSGAEGITSIVATKAIYDSKSNWVNAYLKINTSEDSYLTFTIASGYTAVLKMKMGGYSQNPTVILKKGEDVVDATSGTIGGVASTENNYNEITYNLVAGTYTMTTTVKTLYISHIDLEATAIPAHVVTYLPGEGTGAESIIDDDATEVSDGSTMFTAPEGKIFNGWKDELDNDVEVGTIVTGDMTLTAQWINHYAVTFNMNGHGDAIDPQDIKEGAKATRPDDPVEIGYDFGGWFTDNGTFEVPFDFNTAITAATPLYAKWTAFDGCTMLYPATSGAATIYEGDEIDMQTGSKGATVVAITSTGVVGTETTLHYNTSGLSFEGGGATARVKVTLDHELAVGSKISLTLMANGNSGSNRALDLYKNTTKVTSIGWKSTDEYAKFDVETFTYTVTGEDGLAGMYEFSLYRNNSVILEKLTIEDCGDPIIFHDLTSAILPDHDPAFATVTLGASSVREGLTTTAEYSAIDPAYEFVSWSVSGAGASIDNATANPVTVTMGTEDAVITLNLQLIPEKFTVNYYDGATPMGTEDVELNANPTASTIDTDKRHYTFQGWSETDGGSVVALNTITSDVVATINLFAVYAPVACPTSGTIFSMVFDDSKTPESTVKVAKNGGTLDAAEYATISGGSAKFINTETSDKDAITTDGKFKLAAAKEVMKIELECVLQEGDIIRVPDNSNKYVISTSDAKTGTYKAQTSSQHEFAVTAAWAGVDDIYLLYDGSGWTFTEVEVYRPALLTVSFNLMGHGSAIADIENVLEGSTITAPTAPTDEDYAFAGWYKENTLENAWDFDNDVVNINTTLYAKWLDKSDATLKSLKYGTTDIELEDGVYEYEIALPSATASVPALTAVTNNPAATAVVTDDDAFDGDGKATSTVVVTPQKEGAATQTYTVNFSKLAALPQVNVTGSTTWNFSAGGSTSLTNQSDVVLANLPGINNDENFNSQALLGSFNKMEGTYFQGSKLSFTTEVPGKLTITFRGTNGNTRHLQACVGDGETVVADWVYNSSSTSQTKTIFVPEGKVTLKAFEGETPNNARIYQMIFNATPDYTRDVTEGRYGTICLPKAGVMVGASIFELAYYSESDNKIFMDQVMSGEMVAGRPYVFLPNEGVSTLGVFYTSDDTEDAGNYRGLYGYYDGTDDALQLDPGDGHYILYNNQFRKVTVSHVWIDQNRAYFKIGVAGGIPTGVVAPLPGRRRMSIGAAAPQVTTGMDELNAGEAPVKVLINGELFILRGEKMFDATGRLIK